MLPNYLYSNVGQTSKYLLELMDQHNHYVWLTELKSKEPSNDFFEKFLNQTNNYVDRNTIKIEVLSEFKEKTILKRFVMVEKTSSDNSLDNIDPLVKWSFQCGFFGSFISNLKTFKLTRLQGTDINKSWELHSCTLVHSSLWERNSTFLESNQRTIEGQIISINPNFILNLY